MRLTQKDILRFRVLNIIFVIISLLIAIFINIGIGGVLTALSLFFLFTPYKKEDDI